MQFDGTFLWTDDAAAIPPAASTGDNRRRRFIGASAVSFLLMVLFPSLNSV